MAIKRSVPFLTVVLFSRLLLFAGFQVCLAIFFNSWAMSEKYWMLTATLGNIVSIIILFQLYKHEGIHFSSIFRIHKDKWKKDLGLSLALLFLIIPLAILPPIFLSMLLWNDPTYSHQILFQSTNSFLPYLLLVAFPVTIAYAELPTYFGYLMPRLQLTLKHAWLSYLLPVLFLSLQHITLPLTFDIKFIVFRGISYLPLAAFLGAILKFRPSLLPYIVVIHALLDAMAVIMSLGKI